MKAGMQFWRRVRRLLFIGLILLFTAFCVLESIVLVGSKSNSDQNADIMVILGAMVYQNGQPSSILKQRMNTALPYLKNHPDILVIASGGQGADEPKSEAQTMMDYLSAHGMKKKRILLEDQSSNTYQNLVNTAQLLTKRGYDLEKTKLLIVSNGFHLARVRMLAKRCGLTSATLSAPTPYSWGYVFYCYSRESVALVKSFLLDRNASSAMETSVAS